MSLPAPQEWEAVPLGFMPLRGVVDERFELLPVHGRAKEFTS